MIRDYKLNGFTAPILVPLTDELDAVRRLIYQLTKDKLENHSDDLSLEDKLNINFRSIPSESFWSKLMNTVNKSNELKTLINCEKIKNTFKKIFKYPEIFSVSTFRARLPSQKRVVYDWHQDEGTWYLSKNKEKLNKFPATLWFSINGAKKNDSIQLIRGSNLKKLYNHDYINGQGFFKVKTKIDEKKIYTVEALPSQGVIFNSLIIHRSVPSNFINMRPRYSIDIRYYDKTKNQKIKTDFLFRLKKVFNMF